MGVNCLIDTTFPPLHQRAKDMKRSQLIIIFRAFLLSLTPADAERAIFFAKFESLWAALVPAQAKPGVTGGVDYTNDLVKR